MWQRITPSDKSEVSKQRAPATQSSRPILGARSSAVEQEADEIAAGSVGLTKLVSHASAFDVAHSRLSPAAEIEIDEVMRERGRSLPGNIASAWSRHYGFDFAAVRVHNDGQAARTARTLRADAYALGSHLVFGEGRYEPGSVRGQMLLAHELAHVVQHSRSAAQPLVIRRSLTGALVGGGIGAAVGGVALGLLGSLAGPAGAALGGILGAVAGGALGAYLGDKVSSSSRKLSGPERTAATAIFRTSLDLDKVEIRRGSIMSGGSTPRTSGNTINLPDVDGIQRPFFVGQTLNLTPQGSLVLIHELVHVWQYQHGGFSYVESSLVPQAVSMGRGLSRSVAYDWRNSDDSHIPWERWGAEDQAECISDYNEALQRINADQYERDPRHTMVQDVETVTRAEPYVAKLREGVGAPGSRPAPS
jgi:hypothetical protein